MALAVEMDAREVKKLSKMLDLIAKHGGNVDKPMKQVGVYMLQETDKGFRGSGREGVKWAPLSPATLAIRKSQGRSGRSTLPLMGNGNLRKTYDTRLEGSKASRVLKIFTPLKYAFYHQVGALIRVFGRGKLRPLPKRPQLFWVGKDKTEVVKRFTKHANEVAKDATHKSGLRK